MKVISPKRLLQSVFPTVRNGSIFNASSLDLQFARTKTLDPRVTFTRASSGTYVDSQGVIQRATTNLLLRSEEFNEATSWTVSNAAITANAITAPNGQQTADKLVEDTAASIGHFVRPTPSPSLIAGQSYAYSVFAKAAERTFLQLIFTGVGPGGANIIAGFDLSTGQAGTPSSGSSSIVDIGNGWYRCSLLITASTTATSLAQIRLAQNSAGAASSYTGNGTSGIYLWGAQLEQSSTVGEYIPTTSTINSAPRFDHNPTTGESLGLLVEESRTNLATQSQAFAAAPYATTNGTATDNQAVAPNGTTTAASFLETASTGGHNIGRTLIVDFIPVSIGAIYTFTVFVKANGRDFVQITCNSNHVTNNPRANYDLTSASLGTVDASATASIVAYPNGWRRLSFTVTSAVTAINFLVNTITSSTAARFESFAGDTAKGFFIWGYSVEAGAFPTSYIPTTTAAVTRSADVASITGSNFSSWYRQDEGTVFYDGQVLGSDPTTNKNVLGISNGSGNNAIDLFIPSAINQRFRMVNGGVSQALQNTIPTANVYNPAKVAYAFKLDDTNSAGNGIVQLTDASCTIPTVDRFTFGLLTTGEAQSAARFKRVTFWPSRLPDSTLQQITQ